MTPEEVSLLIFLRKKAVQFVVKAVFEQRGVMAVARFEPVDGVTRARRSMFVWHTLIICASKCPASPGRVNIFADDSIC